MVKEKKENWNFNKSVPPGALFLEIVLTYEYKGVIFTTTDVLRLT